MVYYRNTNVRKIHDGWQVIEEVRTVGTTTQTYSYTYGSYIDDITSVDVGNTRYYAHQGLNHNVEFITDNNKNIVEKYNIKEFGEFTIQNGVGQTITASIIGNNRLFQGLEYDEDLKLYYARNRFYSADLGRFVNRDPIRFSGNDINLYRFVGNNPVNGLDPMGLETWNVEGKSFIAPFKIENGSDYKPYQSPYIFGATVVLAGGLETDDPRKNQEIDNYRLYSSYKINATCNCGKLVGLPTLTCSSSAGEEVFGLFSGIIDPPKVTASGSSFSVKLSGRPPLLAEATFAFRKNRTIYHQYSGSIRCDGNKAILILNGINGSKFPSHALYLDGQLKSLRRQGPIDALFNLED